MYIYHISQYKPCILDLYLVHKKEFTQEEFNDMCKEAKRENNGKDQISYVYIYLKKNYGFKDIGDRIVGYYECINE